jgi:tRNA(Ile)-lysidine synthase
LGYNLITMLQNLELILQDECQMQKHKPVIVGVSGGPDSLCVLDVLDRNGYSAIVAHFNHRLRSSSDDEAQLVSGIAEKYGMQFLLGEGKVRERVTQESESLEEAARNERYRFLFTCAESVGAQGVVVGHSADDQVETVLMHLLRGAGMDGLGGMRIRSLPNAWSNEIPLLRPLLKTWRREILDYCQRRGFDPILDASNEDRAFYRNRLRHELIPYLETYNPAVRKLIWRTAQVMRAEGELITGLVSSVWQACILIQGEGYLALDSQICSQQPLSVQRRILRMAIAKLRPGLRDIGFNAIEQGLEYLQPTNPYAEVDLIAGLRLVSEPGKLWIAEWNVEIPTEDWPQVVEESSELEIGGSLELKSGWRLSAERVPMGVQVPPLPWEGTGSHQVWVDGRQIQSPLQVRGRKDGERLQPFGLDGHSIKLSDFMINEKLPRRVREKWPLVCSGDQIVWVPGYRLAHPFRITEATIEMVNLTLAR